MGNGPIFIGGLSYSGKTNLRLMLLEHPNLVITRRTKMWTRYYLHFGDLSVPANFERCLAVMLQARHIQALRPNPNLIRREFWQGPPTYGHLFALFHAHHAESVGKLRWGDQLGHVEAYADPIFASYPTARMLHMVRDPRARTALTLAASRYRRPKLGWETAAWRRSVRLATRNAHRYPDRYLILHYETLLSRPEKTLRQVCAFLDESFVPEMAAVADGASAAKGRVKRGNNSAALDTLARHELALLQAGVGEAMRTCHYAPQPVQLSRAERLWLPCVDWPLNLLGQALWWLGNG